MRRMHFANQIKKQHGNAITEFAAMSFVLVPLFILVPAIGKISDMNQATIQASRYVAWERTIAGDAEKTDAELAAEVRRRYYSTVDAFIKTSETAQENDAHRHQLWRDHGGRWMLRRFDDVAIDVANDGTPGSGAGTVARLVNTFVSSLSRFASDQRFELNDRGLYRGEVSANVATLNVKPFDQGTDCAGNQGNQTFICIRRHNVILADVWSSRDPQMVASRVQGLVPAGVFRDITVVTNTLSIVPLLQEFRGFRPGHVSPDVIPPDRLGPYRE